MSISVMDCLKLPSMREATVLAGHGGLEKTVTTVSVLEYPNFDVMAQDILVGNELIISSLAYIKDQVDAQCRIIRHLHNMGEAGLILYYLGVVINEPHEELLKLANELDFPVIAMPIGRTDCRYSDVITEIMEKVIDDRKQDQYYAAGMINRIAQLSPRQRTIQSALRLLSDQIHCSILLADRYLRQRTDAPWPISNKWDYEALLSEMKNSNYPKGEAVKLTLNGKKANVWNLPVEVQGQHGFYLIVLDEQTKSDINRIRQAAEVMSVFLNTWSEKLEYEDADAIIRAILDDLPAEKERIAASMHLDIDSLTCMWILQITGRAESDLPHNEMALLKHWLQGRHELVLVEQYGGYLIALTDSNIFEESEHDAAAEFLAYLSGYQLECRGVVCEKAAVAHEAHSIFNEVDEYMSIAGKIFPRRSIFTSYDIDFARECCEILAQGKEKIREYTACLDGLRQLLDKEELQKTLTIYLLDADSNTQETSRMMNMHRNTVKYRLNKIRDVLHFDQGKMPESYAVYRAVAIERML